MYCGTFTCMYTYTNHTWHVQHMYHIYVYTMVTIKRNLIINILLICVVLKRFWYSSLCTLTCTHTMILYCTTESYWRSWYMKICYYHRNIEVCNFDGSSINNCSTNCQNCVVMCEFVTIFSSSTSPKVCFLSQLPLRRTQRLTRWTQANTFQQQFVLLLDHLAFSW